MPGRKSFGFAALLGVAAWLYGVSPTDIEASPQPKLYGKNNTVLMIANAERGMGNVFIAASYALAQNHPDTEVHYVSFNTVGSRIGNVSKAVLARNPSARPIVFHALSGRMFHDAVEEETGFDMASFVHELGFRGFPTMREIVDLGMHPWPASEHIALTNQILDIFEKVDPSLVVVDWLFKPALDAVMRTNRKSVILSPNSLQDSYLFPLGARLFGYPVVASGLPYPLPWYLIPANVYAFFNHVYGGLSGPRATRMKKEFKTLGVPYKSMIDVSEYLSRETPYLSQSFPEVELPMGNLPSGLIPCGPIHLVSAPAAQQDPELTEWSSKAPTILINLGGRLRYSEERASAIARAIKMTLAKHKVQVLWKFKKYGNYSDSFLTGLNAEIESKQVRLESWLNVELPALMETGNIAIAVHHAGAGSFFEALEAGVPHVALPLWADCYDFAARVEYHGIGVWGNMNSGTNWNSTEIGLAFIKILDNAKSENIIRKNADRMQQFARSRGRGRDVAANKIADLAMLKP